MKLYRDAWRSFVVSITITLSITKFAFSDEHKTNICSKSCSSPMNGSYVTAYCDQQNFQLQDRCCINVTDSKIVGIDLQDCGLTDLSGFFTNLPTLKIILLQNNDLPNVTKAEDFEGLQQITRLGLPANTTCPGGSHNWAGVNSSDTEVLCLDERDYCHVYNVSCPANSFCHSTGPGTNECLCSPGFHGYKCLRQGTFPTLIFSCGMGGSTLVLAGLLWCTQRRKIKKNV